MATAKLTKTLVDDMPVGAVIWDTDTRGLGVRRQADKPVFVLKLRVNKQQRFLTIGRFGVFTVEQARTKAKALIGEAAAGSEPMTEKAKRLALEAKLRKDEDERQRAEAETVRVRFATVVERFIAEHARPKNRTWKTTERLLTAGPLATWQDRDIRSIEKRDIRKAIEAVHADGRLVAANRLLAAVRKLFNWCVGEDILDRSPVTGLKPKHAEVPRNRALSDAELGAVWRAAEAAGFPFGAGVRMLILTGQRRSEVFGARWPEFDFAERTWTIPRERAKSDREHIVPLSQAALDLLAALPRIAGKAEDGAPAEPEFLFTTTGSSPFSGFDKAFGRLCTAAAAMYTKASAEAGRTVDPMKPWVMHDLRRTFATGCAKRAVPVQVVEKLLNHGSGTHSGIVGVYQTHDYRDERRAAADGWAEHVLSLVTEASADE